MATHSSILAWRIPRTEEPGGLQFMGSKESDMTERLHSLIEKRKTSKKKKNPQPLTSYIGEILNHSESHIE